MFHPFSPVFVNSKWHAVTTQNVVHWQPMRAMDAPPMLTLTMMLISTSRHYSPALDTDLNLCSIIPCCFFVCNYDYYMFISGTILQVLGKIYKLLVVSHYNFRLCKCVKNNIYSDSQWQTLMFQTEAGEVLLLYKIWPWEFQQYYCTLLMWKLGFIYVSVLPTVTYICITITTNTPSALLLFLHPEACFLYLTFWIFL